MPLVIEGILTTEHSDGSLHYAPMGPVIDPGFKRWTIKPFQSSTTFQNLKRNGRGIFHVTDDCYLLAAAAIGKKVELAANYVQENGWILGDACHWFALKFSQFDESGPRAVAEGSVVAQNVQRPFFGWNRGKHAVLEAAILATRKSILPPEQIAAEWAYLVVRVQKTGGEQEFRAMKLLGEYLQLPLESSF